MKNILTALEVAEFISANQLSEEKAQSVLLNWTLNLIKNTTDFKTVREFEIVSQTRRGKLQNENSSQEKTRSLKAKKGYLPKRDIFMKLFGKLDSLKKFTWEKVFPKITIFHRFKYQIAQKKY
ncbi:MAG: hypothetical protein ACT4OY_06585 [Alphaproteobacteria bacterium]